MKVGNAHGHVIAGLKAFKARLRNNVHWDELPTPLLIAVGAVAGLVIAWLALPSIAATLALAVLGPLLAGWQGRRIRVVLRGEGIPTEVDEPMPTRPVPPPVSAPKRPPPAKRRPPPLARDPLLEMLELPGGRFWMGANKAIDPLAYDNEGPRRHVRVSPFAIARLPVTRGLYRQVMQRTPSEWTEPREDTLPANYVSWEDAVRFCNTLSEQSHRRPCYQSGSQGWACDWSADGYRLPTEAEWEYACRAGTDTPWFWGKDASGADTYAWYEANSGSQMHPVGIKAANPWGLHDITGNVWEWCWDWYAAPYDADDTNDPRGPSEGRRRVLRGGSFLSEPWRLRSAARSRLNPGLRFQYSGFRCVRGSARGLSD